MKKQTRRLTRAEIKEQLAQVGRVGELFVEGDLCRKAWKPHSETFMRGDDMDYNPDAVVPLKKTLLRLERLFPCATTLWRQRPDIPDTQEPLLYGSFSSPEGIMKPPNRGYEPAAMTAELKSVFLKAKAAWKTRVGTDGKPGFEVKKPRVAARDIRKPTLIQHYVPVKDSLGDVVAALEVFTIMTP